ncbi:MAG TPA: hypothetical protein VNA25_23225 [Phycisphaerae bacterium]|nr:hypothetical protein [Phycisphaerae bacterium]
MINEETGAVLLDLGGAVINVDMVKVDVDALIDGIAGGKKIEDLYVKLSADPATQTTLAAILAALADPATETSLAAVLAKLSADPATQTTLAAILARVDTLAPPAVQLGLAQKTCDAAHVRITLADVGVNLTELRVTCTIGDAELTWTDVDEDPAVTGERILSNSGPIRIPVPTTAVYLDYVGDVGALLKMNFLAGAQPPPE